MFPRNFIGLLSVLVLISSSASLEIMSQAQPVSVSTLDQQNLVNNGDTSRSTQQGPQAQFFPASSPALLSTKQYQRPNQISSQDEGSARLPQQHWNRDSYTDVATEYGYPHQQQQSHEHHQHGYGVPSTSYGHGQQYVENSGYDLDEFGSSSIGGIGGLAGLLGLKGLKGLGLLGLLKAIALPAFLFILPVLLILPILLLFLPIPIISVGGNANGRVGGNSSIFGYNFQDIGVKISSISRSVLDSDKCIERVSCEISRYSRGSFVDRTLKRMIARFEPMMPSPILRMARAYMEANTCKQYGCFIMDDSSVNSFKKSKNTT